MGPGLSNFQKRLVHQLVRADFTRCVTVSHPGIVRVQLFDVERENAVQDARVETFDNRVRKQIGMRFLFDAILGASLEHIDPRIFVRSDPRHPVWIDRVKLDVEWNMLRNALRSRKYTIVGHNIFADLLFFYKTFVGALPDRVENFAGKIHQLFPSIVDTKFLATHHAKDLSQPSFLADVDEGACMSEFPYLGKLVPTRMFFDLG